MTTEDIAAVENLTAGLNEIDAICDRIRSDFELLTDLDPQVALAAAVLIATALNGEVR